MFVIKCRPISLSTTRKICDGGLLSVNACLHPGKLFLTLQATAKIYIGTILSDGKREAVHVKSPNEQARHAVVDGLCLVGNPANTTPSAGAAAVHAPLHIAVTSVGKTRSARFRLATIGL